MKPKIISEIHSSLQINMDEDSWTQEVAAITSNSALSTSSASDSLEVKELSAEDPAEDLAQPNGETDAGTEDVSEKERSKQDELIEEVEKDDIEEDAEEEEGLEGGLENDISEEQLCRICDEKYKQPRVLSCLHVFCTPCLEKQLEEGDTDGDQDSITEGTGVQKDTLKCSQCKQPTVLTSKGVEGLSLDTVMVNILDMAAMNDPQIVCTSCKAREKAVARCNDCASFLCPNCVTAHQYMRCFENHKVMA